MNEPETCCAPDCLGDVRAKGLCKNHYQRQLRKKTGLSIRHFDDLVFCSVSDCARTVLAKGLCNLHYIRNRNGIKLDAPMPTVYNKLDMCTITGCAERPYGNGLCRVHYHRSLGGFSMTRPLNSLCDWTKSVSYESAHKRIRKTWGPATLYECMKCVASAHHWAYDGTDPTQLLGDKGQWYSRYPEFYMPMCRRCHGAKDGAAMSAELLEYRKWKLAQQEINH
jgi:hypothetical protein